RPERFRSAATMEEISAPMASPDRKSVMAIGSGSTLPLLTSISTSARAGSVAMMPNPAASALTSMIVFRNIFMKLGLFGGDCAKCGSEHLARVEIDDDVRPGVVFFGRKIVGRAAGHRTASRFG